MTIVQSDAGFEVRSPPPVPPGALHDCRPPLSGQNPDLLPPRQLVRMRANDDVQRVLAFTFAAGSLRTFANVCSLDGALLDAPTLAGDWTPGPNVRAVDVNRDHQPDLVPL